MLQLDFDPDHNRDLLPPARGGRGPVVQICAVRPMEGGSVPRDCVVVSDGAFYTQMVLAGALHGLVEDGSVARYCIVSLDGFELVEVSGEGGRKRRCVGACVFLCLVQAVLMECGLVDVC